MKPQPSDPFLLDSNRSSNGISAPLTRSKHDEVCYVSVKTCGLKSNARHPPHSPTNTGDIVLAHHKLAHRGGVNHSPHIRYQVYFRLSHVVSLWLRQVSNHTKAGTCHVCSLDDAYLHGPPVSSLRSTTNSVSKHSPTSSSSLKVLEE